MKKNVLYIISAVAVMVSVCYYLYNVNANYDGRLIYSLETIIFTIPLLDFVNLWRIITSKNQVRPKQKLWQKILCLVFYIASVAAAVYLLIDSKFYELSTIIFIVILVAFILCAYIDYKKDGKVFKNPVLSWAVVLSGFYALVFVTVFTYIQVVSPVTVEQATNLVAEKYGDDAYQFVGHLDFNVGTNPIGVYWFSQKDANSNGWVEVDLITGDVKII